LDVLFPQVNTAGKLADIRSSKTSNQDSLARQGLTVLREWIRDAFHHLNPSYTTQMLELFLIASGEFSRLTHRTFPTPPKPQITMQFPNISAELIAT
jgi:hypothetical protein